MKNIKLYFAKTLSLAVLATCGVVASSAWAQAPKEVRIINNWFGQSDQAGYWQAMQDNLGKESGIKLTVLQGGPRIQTIPQVASGQIEFGIGNADDVLLARLRGTPVKAVFAHFDYTPYTLVYHADPSVKTLTDLKDRTFAVALGSAYWEWAKKQYKLAGVREIPVTGDLSLFRNDPKMVQQGYSLFLPARMTEAGIPTGHIDMATLGYRPYNVMFTSDDMIKNHPEIVKATVLAVQKGWTNFVRNPSGIKPFFLNMNKSISSPVHDAAVKLMIEDLISHDLNKVGCMTDARWSELAGQLRSVNFLPANFNEKLGYDRSFLPGC